MSMTRKKNAKILLSKNVKMIFANTVYMVYFTIILSL